MPTRYSMEIRLLVCPACCGPLEVTTLGGVVDCTYCNLRTETVPRGELAVFRPPPPPRISEAERLARLESRADTPDSPPPGIVALTEPGPAGGIVIPPHLQAMALAAWQRARIRCQAHQAIDAAEELLFLTNVFGAQLVEDQNWARHRAMIESAFEAVFLPRHRAALAADLVCSACRDGDLIAAKQWFELLDAHSDDPMADSNHRLAKARLFAAKEDWSGVLAVLGERNGEVPIHEGLVASLTAHRADALERLGRLDVALGELVAGMQASRARRDEIARVVKAHGLCPASYAMAEGRLAAAEAAALARTSGASAARLAILLAVFVVTGAIVAVVFLTR